MGGEPQEIVYDPSDATGLQLNEIMPDVRPVVLQAIEVMGRVYNIQPSRNQPNEFIFSDGTNLYLSDAQTMRVTIRGVLFDVHVEQGLVSLSEINTDIRMLSNNRVTIDGVEYLVQSQGDGNYILSTPPVSYPSQADQTVDIDGTSYYLFKDDLGRMLLMKQSPDVSVPVGGRIVILGEKAYTVTANASLSGSWIFKDKAQTPYTSDASGAVVIDGLEYRVVYDAAEDILTVSKVVGEKYDFNGDGTASGLDFEILRNHEGAALISDAQFLGRGNGVYEKYMYPGIYQANASGDAYRDYYLDYRFQVSGSGEYEVGLDVINFNPGAAPAQLSKYTFEVYVDDMDIAAGTFDVPVDAFSPARGGVTLQLPEGEHTIRFRWINPETGAALEIRQAFVRDVLYQSELDLNHDHKIDAADQAVYLASVARSDYAEALYLNGKNYYLSDSPSG
ncbi:MAG: hypothetical protein KDK34_00575, partial [Leptospiraceae bacterium]|nr:hypothetical protein [Leptospiraceae bacterium]